MRSKRRSELPQPLDDTKGGGPLEGGGPRGDAQFHIAVAQMCFYRVERRIKVRRNINVCQPLGQFLCSALSTSLTRW